VSQEPIRLYYKNVLAKVIDDEHGITDQQWDNLAAKVEPLIPEIRKEVKGHVRHPKITKTAYGSLPADTDTAARVMKLVGEMKAHCENLVVLGIGGSALGNIALQTSLNPFMYNLHEKQRRGCPRLFVFDNVDPAQLSSFLHWLGDGLDRTVFNVISKSGRAAETAAQFLIIYDMLVNKYGQESLAEHIVVTTGFDTNEKGVFKSSLYRIAKGAKPELPILEVPRDVGGRFSVLSAVGLFSAAMCGIDIDSLLAGARDMDERVSCEDFYKNPAAIIAAINHHFYNRGKRTSVMMPYSYALKDWADWYRQLWAESLGKSTDLNGREVYIGPTPIKALGTTDQHSQVQLYREGPNDKLFTFLEVENFDDDLVMGSPPECTSDLNYLAGKKMSTLLNSEKRATEYALLESQRPCLTVLFHRVTPYTVGQFIHLFEATTSFMGALFNIDTYNQQAVELGKEATFALMGKPGRCKPELTYDQFARYIRSRTDIDPDFLV
jgi:glucose-6-phosphate isomerase